MARLYADENFPFGVVKGLRARGHDVLTVQEAGMANRQIGDQDVLAFAAAQGRAVLTINRRDFIRLHAAQSNHAGIIVCTQDTDVDGQAERIHQLLSSTQDLLGRLLRVVRPRR